MFFTFSPLVSSLMLSTVLASDLGTSPWFQGPSSLLETRAGKNYIRKEQSDPYCPESWLIEHLKVKDKPFSAPFEVYSPTAPEDGLLCEYAISKENKAIVMLDVDRSSEVEIDSCYRDGLLDNMKHKLGAKNVKMIVAADLSNKILRDSVEAGIRAAGKNPQGNTAVTIKPGDKAWLDFVDNPAVSGILNTLCSGKKEMGNPKLVNFVAVSQKAKPGRPDLHFIAKLS